MVNSWLQAVGKRGEKWMDLGGNGICGFIPHKYICAGNQVWELLSHTP